MEAEIILTHPVLGDTPMGEAQALSVMDRDIHGTGSGGWKYKDKALQAAHEAKAAEADRVRNAPPVKLSTNADQLSGNTGGIKKSDEEADNTKSDSPPK